MRSSPVRRLARWLLLTATFGLSGCASFSPDGGMSLVSAVTDRAIHKDTAFVHSAADAEAVSARVKQLLSPTLSADAAVQVALINNRALQADYDELALTEADSVEAGLPPNPVFSVSRISGDGASEAERQIVGDILALATLPFRSDIARDRFRAAQLKAALQTLRLAAEVRRAYFRAVAANELVGLFAEAKSTAQATAQLATKLGQTGSLDKLDQAREQVFYAETAAELATSRDAAAAARERLARLLGLWGSDLAFRIPDRLPPLPRRPQAPPFIEADAVGHRVDLQIARIELAALAKSLKLTDATRFVTLLDVAGIDRNTHDPDTAPFRERGFDVAFQIPIFDGGEVRVRQAAETYNRAFNRLTEQAINIRSQAREAYRSYRSAYDIASHYQREILPLRRIITEQMQLQFSSMQVDVFALLVEARQRIASQRAAIEANRAFWLAQSELQAVVNGGAEDSGEDPGAVATSVADGGL